jgi:hypothetical protein
MKLNELKLGHVVGDVIGVAKAGKKLVGKEDPKEQSKLKKSIALGEGLGDLHAKFQGWLDQNKLPGDELQRLLKDLEVEAKSRGSLHTMIDDLMSPLTVKQLKTLMKIGPADLKLAAKEEYAHRNQS